MSFPYHCTMCPMKLATEEDLKIHGQVHTENRHSAYDFDSSTEPLFNEFLTAFFPDLNDDYVPALNGFSFPDYRDPNTVDWNDRSSPSSSDDDTTCTTLTNVRIPVDNPKKTEPGPSNVANQNSSIPIKEVSQPPSSVIIKKVWPILRFPNKVHCTEVYQPVPLNKTLVKPVYITRRPPSIAMIQHRYGDDRISRYPQYHTTFLKPAFVPKSVPIIPKVGIEIKKLPVVAPVEPKSIVSMNQLDGATEESLDLPSVAEDSKRSRKSTIGEKPYKCEICFKRFAFIKKFLAHKRIHIVGKLFSCVLCNKRFGYSYKLNQHMRLHATEKECNLCKKTYKNMAHFRRHRCKTVGRKIISKKRSYACTECNRTFGRVNYLNLHKRCHAVKQDLQNLIHEQFLPLEPLQIAFE